ncbi:MAG: GAF domain-containing sensor histidine kinase [Chloroflexota bacterium]
MNPQPTYSIDDIRALAEAGLSLTSELSLSTVLQKVVDVAREQIGARYAALSVLTDDGRIEQFLSSGITDAERAAIGHIPFGRGLLAVLLHEGATLRLEDMSADPRSVGFPPNHPPMKSLLGVPVVRRGKIIGNLYLAEKKRARSFDERDEELLRLLATQAGAAITNAGLYESERARAREWEALFELSRDVTATSDVSELFAFVMKRAADLLDADVAVLKLLSPGGRNLVVVAGSGVGESRVSGVRALSEHELMRKTLEERQATIVVDYQKQRAEGGAKWALMEDEELVSAIAVPVVGRELPLGIVAVGNRTLTHFTEQQAQMLQTFANLIAVAIERRHLFEQLESMARLEERDRIGMDLHDGVIQSIYAVGLHLEDCSDRLPANAQDVKGDVEQAIDDLNKVIKDIRSYIFDLRPSLSGLGDLPQALSQLAEHFRVNTLATTNLSIESPLQAPGGEAEAMAIFHISQEALNNISKHSKASSVSISLRTQDGVLVLEVVDNGVGFDVATRTVTKGAHHGMRNMRDRAEGVGATLEFESTAGEGTTLRMILPKQEKDKKNG